MKKSVLLYLAILIISLIPSAPVSGAKGDLYEENITAITRIDGESFRWESTREFLIVNTKPINTNGSSEIEIELQYDTQNGRIETITQPYLATNFRLTRQLNPDDTPKAYEWEVFLFRDIESPDVSSNALGSNIRAGYLLAEQRIFDLDSTKSFFSVNLQHFEYDIENNKTKRFQVNTEISTKNFADGRVEKAAIHIKKLDKDGKTVIEYDLEIQQKSQVQRYLNYLDQPSLFVPLQIGVVFLAVYLYLRGYRYWTNNEITIIKAKGKKITIEVLEADLDDDVSTDNQTEIED